MGNWIRLARAGLIAGIAVLAAAAAARAEPCVWPPSDGSSGHLPRLGFNSHYDGQGEHVVSVQPGRPAWRIGMQQGDVIIEVNGMSLDHGGAWYCVVRRTAASGHSTLAIVDGRRGNVV